MNKLSYRLDWLVFSEPGNELLQDVLDLPWVIPQGDKLVPRRGYDRALKLEIGRVDWHTARASQKRLWTFTGTDLDKLDKRDFGQQELISKLAKVQHKNVTRLDFAADVRGAGASPSDVEREWMNHKVITRARSMTPIEARDRKGKGKGKTVYVGSRVSPLFLRVYDKGAEQKTREDWCRVELEAKAPVADKIVGEMARLGINAAGCGAIKRFAQVPAVDWYTDLLSGAGVVDLEVKRKLTDWERWVMDVALPNVVKALDENVPGIEAALVAALAEHAEQVTKPVQ